MFLGFGWFDRKTEFKVVILTLNYYGGSIINSMKVSIIIT